LPECIKWGRAGARDIENRVTLQQLPFHRN
jgi:hypothetical protein